MRNFHQTDYTDFVQKKLFNQGIIKRTDKLFLQPLPANRNRNDVRQKRVFRVWRENETVCHLTVGTDIRKLYQKAIAFSTACPDITCKPIFFEELPDMEVFAQEFFEGTSIEEGYTAGEFTAQEIAGAIDDLMDILEDTLRSSTAHEMEDELINLQKELFQKVEFGEFDNAVLSHIVFPLVREELSRMTLQKRWTNGDFIGRNILLNKQGIAKLIDYEFAAETHFFNEDWIRLESFSHIPEAVYAFLKHERTTFTTGLRLYFNLRQMLLEAKISAAHDLYNRISYSLRNIYFLINTTDFGAPNSIFWRIMKEKEAHLGNLDAIVRDKDAHISSLDAIVRDKDEHISSLDAIVRDKDEHISSLDAIVRDKDEYIGSLEVTVNEKNKHIGSLEATVNEKDGALNKIHESHGWKALLKYYKIKSKLFPQNSGRELFAKLLFRVVSMDIRGISMLAKDIRARMRVFIVRTCRVVYQKFPLADSSKWYIKSFLFKTFAWLIKNTATYQRWAELHSGFDFKTIDNPTVSVIIPVYNKIEFTYRCLRSIYNNPAKNSYEIIVVDDKSSNSTRVILSRITGIHVLRNEDNIGFIGSCNKGAAVAKGKYLLFLNNDTQVTPNWLDELVNTFNANPDAGAVGAKLIYPDGRLQEAGGIVWNDPVNLAWNFGRYDDPNKWEYNYVKDVDYCSGACLLVRKDLFEMIGLFDRRYEPAYCEDTDLSFGIRKLGYKVMYQPKAEIVHFEGITSGTDTSQGVKQFQVINQGKFYQKWQEVLEESQLKNGENVFLARDRSQNKKVLLFVDHYVPTWDKDAGSVRMYEYLKVFLEMGFKIIFWPDNLYKLEPYTTELQQMGIEVIYGPNNFETYMKMYGGHIDIAYLSRPSVAINYISHIKQHSSAKIFYDCHDLHFLREQRQAANENNPHLLEAAAASKKNEFYLMRHSDATVVLSDVEKQIIEKEDTKINVAVLPYIQQLNKIEKGYEEKKDLLFIGGFAHTPNEDGVLWFAEEIFPIIKRRIPDVKFIVLGSQPTEKVLSLKSKDIIVTGFVKDVSDYFQNARLFVSPLRYGAGIKGKIAHAMSYGLPVVSTSIGAEGMALNSGDNVMVADKPEEFAEKVIELYTNKNLWSMLSQNSLGFVKDNNSSEIAKKKFEEIFLLGYIKHQTH